MSNEKVIPRRRYPYFDVLAGLAWSEDPESYADGSIDAGRGSHAGQVKVMTQTKRDTLVLQMTTPPYKTWFCLKTLTEPRK
jgi:hypothetical protein